MSNACQSGQGRSILPSALEQATFHLQQISGLLGVDLCAGVRSCDPDESLNAESIANELASLSIDLVSSFNQDDRIASIQAASIIAPQAAAILLGLQQVAAGPFYPEAMRATARAALAESKAVLESVS